jgi:NAD(P)-dependent dehydrogenase (short-subunit alcohol dehydrogenase family)
MKYFITGTRRGLGKALKSKYGSVSRLEDCDVFINCKHDGFSQVEMLYEAARQGKRIINIGSQASDWVLHPSKKSYRYGVEKLALREANKQLFADGVETTCINFGYFDSEAVSHVDRRKMSIEYCVDVVQWVLLNIHRVKEITVCPR